MLPKKSARELPRYGNIDAKKKSHVGDTRYRSYRQKRRLHVSVSTEVTAAVVGKEC